MNSFCSTVTCHKVDAADAIARQRATERRDGKRLNHKMRHRLFADMLDTTLAGGLGRITSSAAFDHRAAP